MRLLVTGAAGRLGSELVKMIAVTGHRVVAFDLPQVPFDAIAGLKGVEVVRGDITSQEDLSVACQDVDGMFHLAAILPPKSEQNREVTMRVNVEGTRNIIKSVKRKPRVSLIFASTVSTYGITARDRPPIGEGHPLAAHNLYSESKIEAERLIRNSGIPHVILRISAISVADLVELPDVIPYRANQRVEFVFVEDAARALLSAFEKPEALGGIYNVAGGDSWQIRGREYIKLFYEALGVEIEPKFSDEYTGLDWYDTSRGRFLNYQKTTLNDLLDRLKGVGEQLGLR